MDIEWQPCTTVEGGFMMNSVFSFVISNTLVDSLQSFKHEYKHKKRSYFKSCM